MDNIVYGPNNNQIFEDVDVKGSFRNAIGVQSG